MTTLKTSTTFDTGRHHIYLEFFLEDPRGVMRVVSGILDTGAPKTEISGEFLRYAGFESASARKAKIKPGQQTAKHGKIALPAFGVCGQRLVDFPVTVSHFEASWGIDALIGLDFFRRFCVTIDYKNGQIICVPATHESMGQGKRSSPK